MPQQAQPATPKQEQEQEQQRRQTTQPEPLHRHHHHRHEAAAPPPASLAIGHRRCKSTLSLLVQLLLLLLLVVLVPVKGFSLQMGLLKVGVPKTWDDSKPKLGYIRNAGVKQFINTYNRVRHLQGDTLLWGDEIEYGIFIVDPETKQVKLSLRAKEIMDQLNQKESEHAQNSEGCHWVPEYGAWMVEATPSRPYTGYTSDLLRVERNMRLRRKRLLTVLKENEIAPTISAFPLLGVHNEADGDGGTVPPTSIGGPVTDSEYIGDGVINPHPRFGTLTRNIRTRRGSKVNIRVPLFRDERTPEFESFAKIHSNAIDGCCGSDAQQLWRYGKGDACYEEYGKEFVVVGCSKSSLDEEVEDVHGMATMQKWLVNVQCEGCKGLFYRSAPNVIVPDADWPRNGDIVLGHEIPNVPGWIRLQNGYYLPLQSDDGTIQFLHRVSTRAQPSNTEMKSIGSGTPLFRSNENLLSALLGQEEDASTAAVNGLAGSTATATATATVPVVSTAEDLRQKETLRAAVHADAMAFGMGCCCLQVTFQTKDMEESRFIYDQLAVLAPILMALTASTPIMRGRLVDTDARWGIISESVDCRTPAERGRNDPNAPYEDLVANGQRRIYKSRYDSISTFIYQGRYGDEKENKVLNTYNDIPVPIDEDVYQQLRTAGIDPALSQHLAHLFIRDPLVVFDGAVEEVDDETQTEHFESIQSTNWQTVRWKPPPPRNSPNDPHIGWRTEFRSMEMQLTDFENAAFSVFAVLVTRVILTFDLNLYIPMSRVDANMQRAHARGASAKGKFFFRRHMAPLQEGDDGYGVKYTSMFTRAHNGEDDDNDNDDAGTDNGNNTAIPPASDVSQKRRDSPTAPGSIEENAYEEMTMSEIMTGKGDYFPGLLPLIRAYLDYIQCDDKTTRTRLTEYLDFIQARATGELVTPATWMRNFVRNHPEYQGDSHVPDSVAYDLLIACQEIGQGIRKEPELHGSASESMEPITLDGSAYESMLRTEKKNDTQLLRLLQRYTNRAKKEY